MKLSLAPIPFFWSPKTIQEFYAEMAHTALDIIYLGETVCYKRRGLRLADWMKIGEQLVAHGKEVVLSSLVLVDGEVELKATRRLCANGLFPVEANDMSAVSLCRGTPFVAGATLNIYNENALEVLATAGASRVVVPIKLSGDAVATLRSASPANISCEALAFGRPPLAFSARCFSARHADRGKDACQWVCEEQPEGILVRTQEDTSFLTINGLQVHAAYPLNYLADLETLQNAHVDVLRIMPEIGATSTIIDAFRGVLDKRYSTNEAMARLMPFTQGHDGNGYWRGVAGQTYVP
jgi:collagenase-like PrtC family protease